MASEWCCEGICCLKITKNLQLMALIDRIIGFYEDIREFNSSNIQDFRGKLKSWIKMGMLAGRIFYVKDMWARDVAALTFASFMALIPFMAMMFVIARGFGYTALLESWISSTFEAQPVVAQTIVNFVHNYIENTQSNYIIGTGIVMFLYTIISLMQKIELTFDDIWHTGERSWKQIVTQYPTILFGLGMMILFASFINVWTVNVIDDVDKIADMGEAIPSFLMHLAAFVPMFFFFVFCYCVIPNTYIRFRSTLVPSFLAGVSMTALQYGYIYLQVFLSSYNVIYGSLAAIPLFLLWLQISWAIVVFGALLCYTNQNLHHYDLDLKYDHVKLEHRIKVCAVVMHLVCHRFNEGKSAYSPQQMHQITRIPQQLINRAVSELLRAKLLVEIRLEKRGSFEESIVLHPIEKIDHLTYGVMIERLFTSGEDVAALADLNQEWEMWKDIDLVNSTFVESGRKIHFV